MTTPPTAQLGGLAADPKWFVWRLTWNADKKKYDKLPCAHPTIAAGLDSADPASWVSHAVAVQRCEEWSRIDPHHKYTLGYRMTPGCGYWFLDLDHHIDPMGVWSATAQEWWHKLPGVLCEVSSSGDGLHFIGRDYVAPHRTRPSKLLHPDAPTGIEMYTEGRSIAFGLLGAAATWGHADASAAGVGEIAAQWFQRDPAQGDVALVQGRRPEWRGPEDDDVLLALALRSAGAVARLGGKASFAQLWAGSDELGKWYGGESEMDAGLCQHLAFWTGCDKPRMLRMMLRSGLVRPKWSEHRTYLEITIDAACMRQREVYCEQSAVDLYVTGQALPPLPQMHVPDEAVALQATALDLVSSAASDIDMHNRVMPAVRALGLPGALLPRVCGLINKQLALWDAKLPLAQIRALVGGVGPRDDDVVVHAARPDWVDDYVYLSSQDGYLEIPSAALIGVGAIHRKLSRMPEVPLNERGDKMDVSKLLAEVWDVKQAHDCFYHAAKPQMFDYDGKTFFNTYNADSVPMAALGYTPQGVAGIEAFRAHVWRICGGRDDIATHVMYWFAHQAQRPGVKVKWMPLIIGFEGSGKSLYTRLLHTILGQRNVSIVDPASLGNSGRFTDWAEGKAVTVLEEVYMAGDDRHVVHNMMKPFITDLIITINRKGRTGITVYNGTNYLGYSNHHDAVPVDGEKDRRYFVIASPYGTIGDMLRDAGVGTDEEYFDVMFDSLDACGPEWRKYFTEYPIPADWPPQRAPMTREKLAMAASSRSDEEMDLAALIEEGGHGVGKDVFSSSCLQNLALMRNVGMRGGKGRHHMYVRMGFVAAAEPLWWGGKTHRVWVRPGVNPSPDNLKKLLDFSLQLKNVL